jgi:hypothetical protein
MIAPFPLAWPDHQPRSRSKGASKFRTTRAKAIANVEDSISRFASDSGKAAQNAQVTSNVAGLSARQPDDTGVSVWFEWYGFPGALL